MRMALAGAGITIVNDHFAIQLSCAAASWSRCCPTGAAAGRAWAVFPGRRLMPARTRVFLDALAAKFTGPECQAIEAQVKRTKAGLRQKA